MLQASGLTKRYPGVTALDQVDFAAQPGEVVALLGENGAGKSTLIKLLAGLQAPDEGSISWEGVPAHIGSPRESMALGIAVIHQELSNLDNLDIAANIVMGREPRRFGVLIDRAEAERTATLALNRVGLDLSPRTLVRELSIAQQQLVEIAKALSMNARLVIMDEPTSSLTSGETETLLGVIRELRAGGTAVVYVSHRLDEVKAIADRAVVLRDGKNAGELTREELSTENMVRLMVGRDVLRERKQAGTAGDVRLKVTNLRTKRYPQHSVSFEVRAGEIVGIAGLVGAGRTELLETLFGVQGRVDGTVELDGAIVPPNSPHAAIERGFALAPEDRRHTGLVTSMNVRENVTLATIESHSQAGLIQRGREVETSKRMGEALRIKTPSTETSVSSLSGGNQQKVVFAKWLVREPKVFLLDEPTRGIDVGARSEIYGLMRELAEKGAAILMVSSDLEEILAMSDRVLVFSEGMLTGEVLGSDADSDKIMRLAVRAA